MRIIKVKDTINNAINEARNYPKDEIKILIPSGTYNEIIYLNINNIVIEGIGEVIISYNNYAKELLNENEIRGTFRTATFFIDAKGVTLRNLNIINTSGDGTLVGQAISLYIDGDKTIIDNCKIIGNQDTLFLAPLPDKEYQKGGFKGLKEFSKRKHNKIFLIDSFISGNIDFIFGGATAYFYNCEINYKNSNNEVGYITASSTSKDIKYGFIFDNCRFTTEVIKDVYLGRPWREYAKVVVINSYLDKHIIDEGWHDWQKYDARKTVFFREKNNYGPGSKLDARAKFSKILTDEELKEYKPNKILGSFVNRKK